MTCCFPGLSALRHGADLVRAEAEQGVAVLGVQQQVLRGAALIPVHLPRYSPAQQSDQEQ